MWLYHLFRAAQLVPIVGVYRGGESINKKIKK